MYEMTKQARAFQAERKASASGVGVGGGEARSMWWLQGLCVVPGAGSLGGVMARCEAGKGGWRQVEKALKGQAKELDALLYSSVSLDGRYMGRARKSQIG